MRRASLATVGFLLCWLVLAAPAPGGKPAVPAPVPAETAEPRPAPAPETAPGMSPAPAATQDPAATTGGPLRRQVSDTRVFSSTSTCFYGTGIDAAQAKRLCSYQTRGKLIDAAASGLALDPAVARLGLSPQDLRAFADSLMQVDVADEEVRTVADGLAVRLTLRARTPIESLAERVAAFAADPGLRAAALAETAKRDRQAAEARVAAVPFGADREFRARDIENEMREDAAFAARSIVPGMSMAAVKELLGDPAALKQALIGPESYICAGYGRIWVVFRDGLVSCLRTRLDYVDRYATDCHCAGNYGTILKND